MENRENQNPSTGSESDISKSQAQQQPSSSEDRQKQPNAEQSDDQAGFGETATEQPAGEPESGFVGSEGKSDTSSELVEDEDQQFRKDGQGAPEGK